MHRALECLQRTEGQTGRVLDLWHLPCRCLWPLVPWANSPTDFSTKVHSIYAPVLTPAFLVSIFWMWSSFVLVYPYVTRPCELCVSFVCKNVVHDSWLSGYCNVFSGSCKTGVRGLYTYLRFIFLRVLLQYNTALPRRVESGRGVWPWGRLSLWLTFISGITLNKHFLRM